MRLVYEHDWLSPESLFIPELNVYVSGHSKEIHVIKFSYHVHQKMPKLEGQCQIPNFRSCVA